MLKIQVNIKYEIHIKVGKYIIHKKINIKNLVNTYFKCGSKQYTGENSKLSVTVIKNCLRVGLFLQSSAWLACRVWPSLLPDGTLLVVLGWV